MALIDDRIAARRNGHRAILPATPLTINPPVSGAAGQYAAAALADEADRIANTPQGSRNQDLNTAAFRMGQLIGARLIDADSVRAKLTEAAKATGLPDHEIATVLRDNPTSALNRGMLEPRHPEPDQLAWFTITETTAGEFRPATEPPDDDPEHSTWWPAPILQALRGDQQLAPTHLMRDDGQCLFYPGKINGLLGESESGKSWIAETAMQQALTAGETVLLLDFEDSPDSVHERMLTLGLNDDQLAGFHYASPDEAWGAAMADDWATILTRSYGLIVLDGINAGMVLLGLDPNSTVEATLFATKVLRPLAGSGACVVTVDHLPKNVENRGKGGIGAQAKRAMMDGCALLVEVSEPFGRGQSGTLYLTVDKDRLGHIRGVAAGGKRAGQAHIDSVAGAVRIHISGPLLQEQITWQPTEMMRNICDSLRDMGPLSFRQLKQVVTGRDDTIRMALTGLIGQGYIRPQSGPRNAIINHLVKPYDPPDQQPADEGSDDA